MERLRRGAEAVRLVTGTTYATVVASGSPCTTSSPVLEALLQVVRAA